LYFRLATSEEGTANITVLLQLVRLLRNCCAAGEAAATPQLKEGVHTATINLSVRLAADLLASNISNSSSEDPKQQLLLCSTQLLANISVASSTAATAVWEGWFPKQVHAVLATGHGKRLPNTCRNT
jgi:hypothetical protein